ncbi:carboxylesterase/lipase family protein [Consotaella aegiceratis]|uniref:carboxylesterase/lipase family protein n=1 Tax=Consotaella aegiceratis TaxID=3097961 RepID=UPI002F42FBF8
MSAVSLWPMSAMADEQPRVTLDQGVLVGQSRDGAQEFLGVRYGEPPVGNLRWKPPVPVHAGSATADATHPGKGCAQGPSPFGTASNAEDCLFLNVVVPDGDRHKPSSKGKPVMVWFHGGGLTNGSGDVYDAEALARENDVIVVTVNYRLGALGFFAHPALDRGQDPVANYGFMDQQQALRWVKGNIAAFGGDPRNVTIAGESAGGLAVYTHLVSPLAIGLFQRAIIESGVPADEPLAKAEEEGEALATKVGCPSDASAEAAKCLRAVPVGKLLAAQETSSAAIIDGKLLQEPITAALTAGDFAHVPVLNGSNHDEGTLIAAFMFEIFGKPLQAEDFAQALAMIGSFIPGYSYADAALPAIETAYDPADYKVPALAAAQVFTDSVIACPAFEADKALARHTPVYAYELADENAPSIVAPPVSFPYGAAHFSELQYLFDMSAITIDDAPALTPAQKTLGHEMRAYWAAFAQSGDPGSQALPEWPRFDPAKGGPVMSLTVAAPQSSDAFATTHRCKFWQTVQRR